MKNFLSEFLDIIFPTYCFGCGTVETKICDICYRKINFTPVPIDKFNNYTAKFWRLNVYDSTTKRIILAYKELLQKSAGIILAVALAEGILVLLKIYADRLLVVGGRINIVIAPTRRIASKNRGFNPMYLVGQHIIRILKQNLSDILINHISNKIRIQCFNPLYLSRFSKDSVGLNLSQRKTNIINHLKINQSELFKLKISQLAAEENINIFIDDVLSSGSTAHASMVALIKSGVYIDHFLVFAA